MSWFVKIVFLVSVLTFASGASINQDEICKSGTFACKDGKWCIPEQWVCDGEIDCIGDASDESNCSKPSCAADTEFQCTPELCISSKLRCDGKRDCINGKDELGCSPEELPTHCGVDQFHCSDHFCISGARHCDGQSDCRDGSDEHNCSEISANSIVCDPKTHFSCGSGQCIILERTCDGKPDCPNSEDEPSGKCGVNECAKDNGGCSFRCVDTPTGFYCECDQGFRLDPRDNRTCIDIDECQMEGTCSQLCLNNKGDFKCKCVTGYMTDLSDDTRCKAVEGDASLLFSRRRDIRKISLTHPEMISIVKETNTSIALDFVFRTGIIIWSDIADKKIYKASINESNDINIVISDEVVSEGLAVDWIYNHIYWSDTKSNSICLANFDGKMRKTLIKGEIEKPRAVAVDPLQGWLFWTDWGRKPKIERAGMDGSHRQSIIADDIKWPNGLTLDFVRRRLYWVDANLKTISACDYDGQNRRLILFSGSGLRHPFSITTFEDWLYWIDWRSTTIFKANKFTGRDLSSVTAEVKYLSTVCVYHQYRQPDGENHCQAANGHCSHLCLPAPEIHSDSPKISCSCPDGLRMLSDGLTCVQSDSDIV